MAKPVVTSHNSLARAPKDFKKSIFSFKLKVPVSNLSLLKGNVNEIEVQFSLLNEMSRYKHRRHRNDIPMKRCQL
jgi:hypothetical protein